MTTNRLIGLLNLFYGYQLIMDNLMPKLDCNHNYIFNDPLHILFVWILLLFPVFASNTNNFETNLSNP